MTEQQVSEEEALIAAGTCDTVESALQMLQQECQLCMNVMKITEVCKHAQCFFFCSLSKNSMRNSILSR